MTARRSAVSAPWLRLWAVELAATVVAVGWLVFRLHPVPSSPWPASVAGVGVWRDGLVWPSLGSVAGEVLPVVVVWVGLYGVDTMLMRRQRLTRFLRWRWHVAGRAALRCNPQLRHIRHTGGIVDATVIVHGGDANWSALEKELDVDDGRMLRRLRLNRELGTPIRAELSAVGCKNPATTRRLRLLYIPLPLPDTYPAWEKPADGTKLFVGHTVEGPLMVDLEMVPHLYVVGPTGSGKGQTIACMEIQALRAGWLIMVLDGGNSPEHAILDPAPTVLRPMLSAMSVAERLKAAILHLLAVKALMDARSSICEVFGVTRLADLPADVQAWLPTVALVIDETTTMLGESKDKTLDDLRKELRSAIDGMMRTGRKFGIHVMPMADQQTYSQTFSVASQRQAEGVIVLGNMDRGAVRRATGRDLAEVPDATRCGHYVRFGTSQAPEIRVPFHPQALRRAVEYVVAQTSTMKEQVHVR